MFSCRNDVVTSNIFPINDRREAKVVIFISSFPKCKCLKHVTHKVTLFRVFLSRVRNLYHVLKTLVGQCRIYLRAKCTLKIYD